MKKLLVLSDSHGRKDLVKRTLDLHRKEFDWVFHLGDFSQDMFDYYGKEIKFYSVKGNMDPIFPRTDFFAEDEIFLTLENLRAWLVHGHQYEAHFSLEKMLRKAKVKEINIVFYGHTHREFFQKIEDIYFFNPGALKSLSYGFIIIDNESVEAQFLKL